MKRQTKIEIGVFVLIVTLGVSLRLLFRDVPNFAPIAALALFAGYFFRSWLTAFTVPLCVMMISDMQIGGYHPWLMLVVYGMLALPVTTRGLVRRYFQVARPKSRSVVVPVIGLLTCSIGMSVLFFLVTNFAHWLFFPGMYDLTFAGLVQCYLQALPFFRHTLTGDMFFAFALFGSYALAVNLGRLHECQGHVAVETR